LDIKTHIEFGVFYLIVWAFLLVIECSNASFGILVLFVFIWFASSTTDISYVSTGLYKHTFILFSIYKAYYFVC